MKKKIIKIIAILCVSSILFLSCSRQALVIKEESVESELESPEGVAEMIEEQKSTEPKTICVYVCGAVKTPGIVEVSENGRVNEALEKAGGFDEDADEDYVNLAAILQDGEKIYFPYNGEMTMQSVSTEENSLVNINSANCEELMRIPGIGESRAKAIIEYREKNGNFTAVEDVMKVNGVKNGLFQKMKDYIKI